MKSLFYFYLLLCCMVFVWTACEDKNDDPIPETPTENMEEMMMPCFTFDGITPTDIAGVPMGMSDTSDWQLMDDWTEEELALFEESTQSVCGKVDSIEIAAAFPNPAKDMTNITLRNFRTGTLTLRLVDECYEEYARFEQTLTDNSADFFAISLDISAYEKDSLRIYYKVALENCELRGHGDILIEK